MRTRSIGFAVIAALAALALTVPSLAAKQQTTTKWDYLRVTPGFGPMLIDASQPGFHSAPHGYKACQATDATWQCREFREIGSIGDDDSLRRALATLGGEGWELVSAVDESSGTSGLTYLLKRPRQ